MLNLSLLMKDYKDIREELFHSMNKKYNNRNKFNQNQKSTTDLSNLSKNLTSQKKNKRSLKSH
jgi:hypothetical protein